MNEKGSINYQFGYEFFQAGDLIRALTSVLKGLEAAPNSADLHNLLGLIYFRQKDYVQAEQDFRKANAIDPRLPEVYNNLGAMLYESGRLEEAKTILLKGVEFPLYLNPERIHNNLGLVYEGLKDRQKAGDTYRTSIRGQPISFLP